MKKTVFIKKALLSLLALALFPFLELSDAMRAQFLPNIEPRYILRQDTTKDIYSDATWDYYPLAGDYAGGYAVSLRDEIKATYTGDARTKTITVEATVTISGDSYPIVGIWHGAFLGNNATTIKFAGLIKVIDFEAFMYARLTTIEIPYTIEHIGDAAFYGCNQLATVRIQSNEKGGTDEAITCACDEEEEEEEPVAPLLNPNAGPKEVVTVDGLKWCSLQKIPSLCFFRCRSLKEIYLPAYLEEIEWEAFNGCYSLSCSFYFRNIKKIRARAFQGCSKIPLVYISSSMFVKNGGDFLGIIEPHAFNYCGNNIQFQFNGTVIDGVNSAETWRSSNGNWGLNSDTENSTYNALKASGGPLTITSLTEPSSTADWTYTDSPEDMGGITITGYTGRAPVGDWVNGYLIVPSEITEGNVTKEVTMIRRDAFSSVASKVRRLYLPDTLKAIDNKLFDSTFNNLVIIDDSSQVCRDQDQLKDNNGVPSNAKGSELERRIDLSRLLNLQFIGNMAFSQLARRKNVAIHKTTGLRTGDSGNVGDANGITKIHLPRSLIAVGDNAFSDTGDSKVGGAADKTSGYFQQLLEFKWDYEDGVSRLEAIGNDAFWKLGWNASANQFPVNIQVKAYRPSTLVFPKTFRFFGMLNGTKVNNQKGPNLVEYYQNEYGFDFSEFLETTRTNRPAHHFTGCPLIKKVIFKGGNADETRDLAIPSQCFSFCASLQTFICEERVDHVITFHTQGAAWSQNSMGYGSDSRMDFRGDPMIQTIVLPSRYTKLRFQNLALQGCARAALYFSGKGPDYKDPTTQKNPYIKGNKQANGDATNWPRMVMVEGEYGAQTSAPAFGTNDCEITDNNVNCWRKIGNEDFHNSSDTSYKGYIGYVFANSATTQSDAQKKERGTFKLNQDIPFYSEVHYKEVLKDCENHDFTVEVGKGRNPDSDSPNKFTIYNKCAYVCDSSNHAATMSKYLYDLRNGGDANATATVAGSVHAIVVGTADTKYDGVDNNPCIVKKIGDSAFSAAFCDGTDGTGARTDSLHTGTRTYNAETEKYEYSNTWTDLTNVEVPDSIVEIGNYAFMRAYGVQSFGNASGKMPTSLKYIGEYAFAFCNIRSFLEIPSDCIFFENTNNKDYQKGSVFSNNFNLRQITFKNSTSNYYSTAEYVSATGSEPKPIYTTALYSKNKSPASYSYVDASGATKSGTFHKNNRLLLVLNRDGADYHQQDNVATPIYAKLVDGRIQFDGTLGAAGSEVTTPFLFGAYRMAYWVESLKVGPATRKNESSGDILPQPLVSGICNRTGSGATATWKDEWIYLRKPIYDFQDNSVDIYSFFGDVFLQPEQATRGFTATEIVLRKWKTGDGALELPEGIFSENTSDGTKYRVEGDGTGTGVLNLKDCGWSAIGKDAFKNNLSIQKVIAPTASGGTFTIKANAFSGCTNLTHLDLSNVAGTIVFQNEAFAGCNIQDIDLPDPDGSSVFNLSASGIFKNNVNLNYFVFPTTTDEVGSSCFEGCSSLATVTGNSNIVTIGASAFKGCALTDFDFDSFTKLTTIGDNAFQNAGVIANSGAVDLPAKVETIGSSAFCGSSITGITFNGDDLSLGANAFNGCTDLTYVRFGDPNCNFGSSSIANGVFSGCTSLTELQLPTTFNLGYDVAGPLLGCSNDLKVYSYSKTPVTVNQWASLGNDKAKVYFLVEDLDDLLAEGSVTETAGVYSATSTEALFWYPLNDGSSSPLGKVTGVSQVGNDVTVTFTSGSRTYTLTTP